MSDPASSTDALPEVAYYYPEWHWRPDDHGWVKSLLLFFDQIALLVPDYKRHEPANIDPEVAGSLEDAGFLRIIEPADSGGFRTAIPVDFVQRFRRFSYMPEEAVDGPRVS